MPGMDFRPSPGMTTFDVDSIIDEIQHRGRSCSATAPALAGQHA